jgi:hypothetical protein
MFVDLAPAAERELGFKRLVPVKRPVPAMSCDRGPAVREPEQGIFVRARLDEVAEFAVRYEPVADLVRVQERVWPIFTMPLAPAL